jgi:UDP-N-acetylmuramoylalanine--D-glutamate ligase
MSSHESAVPPRRFEPWSRYAQRFSGRTIHVLGIASTESTAFVEAVSAVASPQLVLHDFSPTLQDAEHSFHRTHVALSAETRRQKFAQLRASLVDVRLGPRYLKDISEGEFIFAPQSWDLYANNAPLVDLFPSQPERFISLLGIYLQCLPCPVVGITGTNGKTTVTSLAVALLEAAGVPVVVGGNHRYFSQLLPNIAEVSPSHVAVLEVSHKHLTTLERGPDVAVVTNVEGDHLDELPLPAYVARKRRLVEALPPDGWAVLNVDCPVARSFAEGLAERTFRVSLQEAPGLLGGFVDEQDFVIRRPDHELRVPRHASALLGPHNRTNALLALAVASLWTQDTAALERGLRDFRTVKHRLEFLRTLDGVKVYDDTASTSPAATRAAVLALFAEGQRPVCIIGGRDKNNDWGPLAAALQECARAVVLLEGTAAAALESALHSELPLHRARDLREALAVALSAASPGDSVVVSPAGAGFQTQHALEGQDGLRQLVRRWTRDSGPKTD